MRKLLEQSSQTASEILAYNQMAIIFLDVCICFYNKVIL